MSNYVCHHEGLFFCWNDNTDSPSTYGGTRDEILTHLIDENNHTAAEAIKRVDRAEKRGTSSLIHSSLNELIQYNHAGDNGEELTFDEIIAMVKNRPSSD